MTNALQALNGKAREIGDFIAEWYNEHKDDHKTAWFEGYIIGCATYGIITEEEQDQLEDILKDLAFLEDIFKDLAL